MKQAVAVEFRSIRQINDFCQLNRKYRKRLNITSDIINEHGDIIIPTEKKTFFVSAEGNAELLSELFDSYRLCGIA